MKKFIIATVLTALSAFGLQAQTTAVTGTVIASDNNQPLIGVTVAVDGTNNLTITDFDGKFELKVKQGDKTLTLSYIGMMTKTVDIAPEMVIYLDPDTEALEEVIVVAFGKQTKEAFTGSATVIKSDELTKRPSNDPVKALQGKVPGLTVISSNNPVSESTLNIRGLGSINASTSPLIIVDGQPFNGSMRDINPSDVDNISILKDAASNALYGARGANGVIMITTKSAQKGTTRVNFDMKFGISSDSQVDYDKIDNPGEYYEAHYLALKNYYWRSQGMSEPEAHLQANTTMCGIPDDGNGGLGYIVYSVPQGEVLIGSNGRLNPNATLGNIVYNNGNYYYLYPDDWKREGLRRGTRQEYNASISGGGDGYSIYLSLGALDQKGISYGNDIKRYTTRMKFDYRPFNWLNIGANASLSSSSYNNLYETFSDVYTIAPIYPLYLRDINGNILQDARGNRYDYGDGTVGFSRTASALQKSNGLQSDRLDKSASSATASTFNGYANIDLPAKFRLQLTGSVYLNESRGVSASNPYYGYYAATGGSTAANQYRQINENYQQLLTWAGKYGLHNVDVLVGHEYNRRRTATIGASKSVIAMFEENIELDAAISNMGIDGSTTFYNVEGFLGRAQYDYDSRFYASASFRRDASSRFHPDHQWGNFWSVGGAWIMSKEAWFPKSGPIDSFKLKLSYGEQGNDGIGSSFYWSDYYTIKNSNDQVAYTFSWKGNPNITWETTASLNTGVEFSFLKGRASGSVEYYKRTTRDMLYFKSVPATNGYTGYYDNIGDMVNRGVELSLSATPVKIGDFSWIVDMNISYEKNHISRLPETSRRSKLEGHWGYPGSYYFYGEGLPLRTWYLQKYAGPSESGEPMWYVRNSDGTLDTTTSYDAASKFNCGTALPTCYGGFSSSFVMGNFDLGITCNYSIGGKKFDAGYQTLIGTPYGSSYGNNIHRDVLKGWSEENTDAYLPRWQYNDMQSNVASDLFLVDASYLTIQNIQLGYALPKSACQKIKAQSLRFNLSVDGVAYWTARKGFDPRSTTGQYSGTGYGPMRTYLFGLSLQF